MPIPDQSDRFLTTSEVAKRIGVTTKTLEVWNRTGRGPIPFHQLPSGHRRYRLSDVVAYLERAK